MRAAPSSFGQTARVMAWKRFVSFLLMLGLGLLLLVSVLFNTVVAVVSKYLDQYLPIPAFMLTIADIVGADVPHHGGLRDGVPVPA